MYKNPLKYVLFYICLTAKKAEILLQWPNQMRVLFFSRDKKSNSKYFKGRKGPQDAIENLGSFPGAFFLMFATWLFYFVHHI